MLTRRETVCSGLLTLLWGGGACLCPAHAAQLGKGSGHGCSIDDDRARKILDHKSTTEFAYAAAKEKGPKLYKGSGNKDFDVALAHTLSRLTDTLQVLPAFVYFDDSDSPNAFATPNRLRSNDRADGTVLFGVTLMKELMKQREAPETAISAICAHEFGHVLQFKMKLDKKILAGQKTVKRLELHADFLAGYFAGLSKQRNPEYPAAVYATTLHLLGDDEVNNEQHHGRPAERAAAIVKGFETAFRDRRSVADAIEIGTRYVMTG